MAVEEDGFQFSDLVSPDRWKDFDEHVRTIDSEMTADLDRAVEENRMLAAELRSVLEREYNVCTVPDDKLEWAREQLFAGHVCAVDGTYAIFPMLSGMRCRIGVAATSYKNKRTEAVFYVSEQLVHPPEADPLELLRQRRSENSILSTMAIRAAMAYMERQKALERPEEWNLFNGSLVPYELRTGLGRLKALEPCLDLARRLIDKRTVCGVVGTSSHNELTSLGLALRPGEYVNLYSFEQDLRLYLDNAHFNPVDERLFSEFIRSHGHLVRVGVYRAGARAYVFHTHEDVVEDAAAIVMADSLFQPIRSYPLLIDYADSICSRMLASSDFVRQMQGKLARAGQLGQEIDEHSLRRR